MERHLAYSLGYDEWRRVHDTAALLGMPLASAG
jgi:hypothetical protein